MHATEVDGENDTAHELLADADPKTMKRASWEAFAFELAAPGIVQVTNNSHADPDEHSYLVNVEGGAPVVCDCPAFRHQEGPCKHLVAVAIREPVLQAATLARDDRETAMIADGGEVVEQADADHDGAEDACRNGQVGCDGPAGDELSCFECYRSAEDDG